MDIKNMVQQFERFNTKNLNEYKSLISSKHNNEIFPPYIPHVGKHYSKYRIIMYGMAQSMNKPLSNLIEKNKTYKIRQMYDAPSYKNIRIAPYEVMLSIAGIYIFAKHHDVIDSFDAIHDSIAATNYYKFSFSASGNDINPNSGLKNHQSPDDYWKENDRLSEIELDCLKPSIALSFKGRHNDIISGLGINVLKFNDPSWILRGANGVLKKTGSWYREKNDRQANKLVQAYLEQINGKYAGKKDAIKIYLLKYYNDWSST